ncbi:nucleotide exchange factor GrpE [Mycoplasma leonicaptivi]|uniref:nucleotide exchange factor GrpE n=1 Tax=Mycoplasma leonicaptivi TaxID=36742 RepID=UPI000485E54E|nr:nucleotide exchange factor GrpE [Mycoplasma leonicaptivi]
MKKIIKENDILKGNFKVFYQNQEIKEYTQTTEITIGKSEYFIPFDDYFIGKKYSHNFKFDYVITNSSNKELENQKVTVEITNAEIVPFYPQINNESADLKKTIEKLEIELAKKEVEILKLNNDFKEKAKEFSKKAQDQINLELTSIKERFQKEKQDIKNYALQSFFEEFSIPFNNFNMAVKAGENSQSSEVKNYCFGFNIVSKQFEELLNSFGCELITPDLNTEFDSQTQQVVDIIDDNEKDNVINKVVRSGIKLNGRVIVPASVIIYKKISN